MLGPRQRTERMLQILGAAAALGERDAGRIYGPVGLDVGTDGAEQVALSVIAEILAVRSGRRAGSLRGRQAPIHASSEEAVRRPCPRHLETCAARASWSRQGAPGGLGGKKMRPDPGGDR